QSPAQLNPTNPHQQFSNVVQIHQHKIDQDVSTLVQLDMDHVLSLYSNIRYLYLFLEEEEDIQLEMQLDVGLMKQHCQLMDAVTDYLHSQVVRIFEYLRLIEGSPNVVGDIQEMWMESNIPIFSSDLDSYLDDEDEDCMNYTEKTYWEQISEQKKKELKMIHILEK
ncbi:MAG: hypothetical protein EZS28_027901, partial [Streblomastix strix]